MAETNTGPPAEEAVAGELMEEDIRQAKALAQLPRDVVVMRMAHRDMMAVAKHHPRELAKIHHSIMDQLEKFGAFCRDATYTVPVGKELNPKTNRWEEKWVTGLSIRAAEAINEAYGCTAIETSVEIIDDRHVKVSATFFDFQGMRTWRAEKIVPRFYRSSPRKGLSREVAYPPDRFFKTVVPGWESRLVREVVLRMIPASLKVEMQERALELMRTKWLDKEKVATIIKSFADQGIGQDQLAAKLGKKSSLWTIQEHIRLQGMWAALRDGIESVESMFAEEGEQPLEGGTPATDQELAKEIAGNAPPPTDAESKTKPPAKPEAVPKEGPPPKGGGLFGPSLGKPPIDPPRTKTGRREAR